MRYQNARSVAANTLTLTVHSMCVPNVRMNLTQLKIHLKQMMFQETAMVQNYLMVMLLQKVKGSSMVIKRGTKVKSIRLTENPEEVDCKIEGSSIVLKTCFLKK